MPKRLEVEIAAFIHSRAGIGNASFNALFEKEGFYGLSLGIYGDLTSSVTFNNFNDNEENVHFSIDVWKATGDLGLLVQAVAFEFRKSFFKETPTLEFYNRDEPHHLPGIADPVSANDEEYEFDLRPFDKSLSIEKWNGEAVSDGATRKLYNRVNTLAEPKLVRFGDKTMLFFNGTNANADNIANSNALCYSVYDNVKKVWKEPKRVDSNNCYDNNFDVKEINGKLYLTYTQVNREFSTETSDLEGFIGAFDVYAAEFNPVTEKFSEPVRLTQNDTYDCETMMTEIGGKPAVVWMNQAENQLLDLGAEHSVMCSTLGDNGWSEPEIVADKVKGCRIIRVGKVGNDSCAAFVSEKDEQLKAADFNRDGQITVADVTALQYAIAEL